MREILFRGKTFEGEWIVGYYANGKWYLDEKELHFIIPRDSTIFPHSEIDYELVVPETVGQYTGLTDKNGTKIFEGDIVSAGYGELKKCGVVFYYERGAKFGIRENSGYDNLSLLFDQVIEQWNIKVIGNIHDNAELMRKESEK